MPSTLARRVRALAAAGAATVSAVVLAGSASPPAQAQVGGPIVVFDIVATGIGFRDGTRQNYWMAAENHGNTGIVVAIKCEQYWWPPPTPTGSGQPIVHRFTVNVNWEFPANWWAVWDFRAPGGPIGPGGYMKCWFVGKMLNGQPERNTSNNVLVLE